MARNIVEEIGKYAELFAHSAPPLDQWAEMMTPEEFERRAQERRQIAPVDRALNFLIDAACVILFCMLVFIIVWGFTQ